MMPHQLEVALLFEVDAYAHTHRLTCTRKLTRARTRAYPRCLRPGRIQVVSIDSQIQPIDAAAHPEQMGAYLTKVREVARSLRER
jgi:hypothetical protein